MEEVDEAEDEEEVVDAGWAVMRAGLRAAASAAATAGRMEGMSPGCRLGAGGWGGPVVTWRPGGPIWSAAAGEGGAGLWPSLSGLGWARVLQCARSCGFVSAGGNSSRGLHSGAGGGGPGSSGVCVGGVGGPLGGVGVPRGVGLPLAGVCGLSSVGGGTGSKATYRWSTGRHDAFSFEVTNWTNLWSEDAWKQSNVCDFYWTKAQTLGPTQFRALAREHVFVFQYKCPVDGRPGNPNLRLLNHRCGILIQKRALESDIRRHYTGHDTFKFMAGVETLKEVHEVCRLQVDRSSTFTWGTDC